MEKGKKRGANFSGREKEILISLVEKYLKVIENKKTNSVFNKQKLDCWEKISVEYNAMQTTGLRTGAQLKGTYEKMKQIAKLHKSEDKVEIVKTGGGIFIPKLTSMDEKILNMLKDNYFSIPNEFDSNAEVEDGYSNVILEQTQQNLHEMNYNGSEGDENIIIICEEKSENNDPNSNELVSVKISEINDKPSTSFEGDKLQKEAFSQVRKEKKLGNKRKLDKTNKTMKDQNREKESLSSKRIELIDKKINILDTIQQCELQNLKAKSLEVQIKQIELKIKQAEYEKNLLLEILLYNEIKVGPWKCDFIV